MNVVKEIERINAKEASLGLEGASWHEKYADSAFIFVGGLDFELVEGDILCVFSQYGEIVDINLVRDKQTGKSKGFAFICYEDQRSTIVAVDNFNGATLVGRTIRVDHVAKYRKAKLKPEEEKKMTEKEERRREKEMRKLEKARAKAIKKEAKIKAKEEKRQKKKQDKEAQQKLKEELEGGKEDESADQKPLQDEGRRDPRKVEEAQSEPIFGHFHSKFGPPSSERDRKPSEVHRPDEKEAWEIEADRIAASKQRSMGLLWKTKKPIVPIKTAEQIEAEDDARWKAELQQKREEEEARAPYVWNAAREKPRQGGKRKGDEVQVIEKKMKQKDAASEAADIEEQNKLRASLGLKPLR